jgi:hypothetical protein
MLTTAILLLVTLGATKEIGPADNLKQEIAALNPGDELVLRGGTYDLGSAYYAFNKLGTATQPITIRAKDGEQPVITRPDANQNLINFTGAEFVVLKGLHFQGGSRGLRFQAGRSVTIADCEVSGTDDVAIAANDTGITYEGFQILRNNLHDTGGTGEGMYLGCNSGGCSFRNALIEGNHVHHTNGAAVTQGDGIEIKEGSFGNVVRDNVIHDTGYPCIITYSTLGGAPNIIERNLLLKCGDHGIQSARDAIIRNNIILSANSDGIAMQPHQAGSPGNLVVVHNTIIDPDGNSISLRNPIGDVVIANNALYRQSNKALLFIGTSSFLTFTGNVGSGPVDVGSLAAGNLAADFVSANFTGLTPNDVFPKAGGALIAAGVAAQVPADDFNGTARNGVADVGAYAYRAGGNPGWTLAEGFKTGAGGGGGSDAGTGGGMGGGAGGGTGSDAGTGGGAGGGGGATGGGTGGGGATDGGATEDGGTGGGSGGGGNGAVAGGCGCGSAGWSPWAVLSGVALLAWRRRSAALR